MARPGRPERNRAARSFRQLRRFHHVINSDKVFGTHRRPWRAPCASNFGLKFAFRLNSLWIGATGGAFGYLYWGLVMGIEHLPRNKQRRPAEPSHRVVESTDCAVSLPEEDDAPSLWGDKHSYD